MTETSRASYSSFRDALLKNLEQDNIDLYNCVEIPKGLDRLAQFRKIQDILDGFRSNEGKQSRYYLIEVKEPVNDVILQKTVPSTVDLSTIDRDLYHGDGKLNHKLVLQSAELLVQASDFKNAEILYRVLRTAHAFTEFAQIGIARCRAGLNDIEAAMNNYEEALLYQPNSELSLEYAKFLYQNSRYQHAAESLKKYLLKKELAQKLRISMLDLCALCWEKSARPNEALLCYQDLLVLDPKHSRALLKIGLSFLKSKNLEEAERWLRECLENDPQNLDALNGLGQCYLTENKLEDAFDFFQQSLKIEVTQSSVLPLFIKCAIQTRRYNEAIELTEKFIENGPYPLGILYCLAGLYFHTEQYNPAESTCLNILNADPNHKEAIALLGRIKTKHQVLA